MGLFDSLDSIITIWIVIMVIGVPIIIIKKVIEAAENKERDEENEKDFNLINTMNMTSGACFSCRHRDGDHTKWSSSDVVYCFKLDKHVNWIEEDFSKEHPCPYFEGDTRLNTTRR